MALRIWQKLFLGSGIVVFLALLAMTLLMGRSFQSGFVQYLSAWEAAEISELKEKLTAAHRATGDWSFLTLPPDEQSTQWGFSFGPPTRLPSDRGPRRGKRPGPPPPGPRDDTAQKPGSGPALGPPPGRRGDSGVNRPPPRPPGGRVGSVPSPTDNERPPPRKSAQTGLLDISQRVAIVDADGHHLAGRREPVNAGIEHPLMSDGLQIGSLRVLPVPSLRRDQDLEFARRQSRNAILIGLLAMAGAALATLWVSRTLTSPLPKLTRGVRRLTRGHYDERVDIRTGDELQQLGQDFNRLAVALAQHRTQQQSWIAQISHELRTPLAVLTGEIHALIDGVRPVNFQALESLNQETNRLTHLVDDLFLLSVSEAGGSLFDHQPMNLSELLTTFCRENPVVDLDPEMPLDAPILGDPFRLRQLFTNLLQNSEHYSDAPVTIALSLSSDPTHWHLAWEDSPPGVPVESLEHLFDPLFRVEGSRARSTGGAGLGLAIVKTIANAHDGQVRAEASSRGGLKIVLSLPHLSTT
ncbi:MAG: ATP-binding protein [Lysobacterales bacterium]